MLARKTKGILWMFFSVVGFTIMGVIIRYLPNIPIYEKVFFRNTINCSVAIFLLLKMRKSIKIERKYIKFVFGRSFFGFVGMVANFYAIEHLTIADANMLNKLSPVFVTIWACIFLKEKVDRKQIFGIIMMLIAIIFVIRPTFSPKVIPSLIGFSSAVLAGFSYTIIRYLNGKVKSEIIVFYFTLFSVLCTVPFMYMNFVKPTSTELMLLIGIGASAAMGQFGLTYAYTHAPASEVSVYNYTIIVTGLIAGYLLFGEIPDVYSFIGGTIIILTAIFLYKHNKNKKI